MNQDNKKKPSLIPSGSHGLVSVGNSIEITDKIIREHEERFLHRAFPSVEILNQEWMTQNLNVDCYANGDTIPQVQGFKEWAMLTTGAWCYFNNNPENEKIYGKLYNWYAVIDPRGLAPKGWKIPTDKEWTELTDYLYGYLYASTKLKSTSGWNHGGNGTDEFGFSALPGGFRQDNGLFYFIGNYGFWWSASEYNTGKAWGRNMGYSDSTVYRINSDKEIGYSVRCFRD